MNDYSYLMQGINKETTDSSVLISSSRYLNDPRLRDWVATHMLRKNGPDIPTPSDSIQLAVMLRDILDVEGINKLIAREREKNAALDAWFEEGFSSSFTIDDLAQYEPGTVGGIFHKYLVDRGLQVEIVPTFEPTNDFEYWLLRSGQQHDLEHIMGGGGFDFVGELVPYYMRLTNPFVHLSPELAGELSVMSILGATRIHTRAVLHYPETWLTVLETSERGSLVGRTSDPIWMIKYEDIFHLPLEEAREKAGIRNVREVDTSQAKMGAA